jgi:2-polyprenyl-3-methyl-5-hydroxy-6-metoxy-1,4-benzoquinol methylase
MASVVRYASWELVWTALPDAVRRLAARPDVGRVCDLGGGANPILDLDFIAAHDLRYEILDASAEELAKAPAGYATVLADATAADMGSRHGPYDLVASAFVAEHVSDPARFHANVHRMLRPGGHAVHVFPTLYEPAFALNLLVPERLTERLLHRVQPGREAHGAHGKFRAHYRWCRGPSRRQLARLRRVGFEIVDYVGYFGHGYFERIAALERVEQRVVRALVRHPVAALTSYACVILRRPG